jgi:hypothetical protein
MVCDPFQVIDVMKSWTKTIIGMDTIPSLMFHEGENYPSIIKNEDV